MIVILTGSNEIGWIISVGKKSNVSKESRMQWINGRHALPMRHLKRHGLYKPGTRTWPMPEKAFFSDLVLAQGAFSADGSSSFSANFCVCVCVCALCVLCVCGPRGVFGRGVVLVLRQFLRVLCVMSMV